MLKISTSKDAQKRILLKQMAKCKWTTYTNANKELQYKYLAAGQPSHLLCCSTISKNPNILCDTYAMLNKYMRTTPIHVR